MSRPQRARATRLAVVALTAVAALAAGCVVTQESVPDEQRQPPGVAPDQGTTPPPQDEPFEEGVQTIERGPAGAIERRETRVIESAEEFEAFWAEHTGNGRASPAIDFSETRVLVFIADAQPAGCFEANVREVMTAPTEGVTTATVTVREHVPTPEECGPGTEHPYHIVAIPMRDTEVRFEQADGSEAS